jgi:hypothetical protein
MSKAYIAMDGSGYALQGDQAHLFDAPSTYVSV